MQKAHTQNIIVANASSRKKTEVTCPNCGSKRLARNDFIKRSLAAGRDLSCIACTNKAKFDGRQNPKKGTGVKSVPELLRTRNSYYKAKERCKSSKAGLAYRHVEFRFHSLDQLIGEIGIRKEGTTLDRINPLGHYEPGNVRWATPKQQCENRVPSGYWRDKYSEEVTNGQNTR